jgi:hypothetical protein
LARAGLVLQKSEKFLGNGERMWSGARWLASCPREKLKLAGATIVIFAGLQLI